MNKFPIGIQNFESLRREGFLYIDKTALMYRLANEGRYYFLSRPRRFGKSLLISTLEAYFEGKKELFSGLAVENLEKKWQSHPILYLDLNAEDYSFKDALYNILNRWRAKTSHWNSLAERSVLVALQRRKILAHQQIPVFIHRLLIICRERNPHL